MSGSALPTEIRSRLDEIAQYTDRLALAAKERDMGEITHLLERRGQALSDLAPHVERFKTAAGPNGTNLLATERAVLEQHASRAFEQLHLMRDGMRAVVEALSVQNAAARSYVEGQLPGPALDRSG